MRKKLLPFAVMMFIVNTLAFAGDTDTSPLATKATPSIVPVPTKNQANAVIVVYKAGGSSEWAAVAILQAIESVGGTGCLANCDNPKHMDMVRSHLQDKTPDPKVFTDESAVLVIPIRRDQTGNHLVATAQLFGPLPKPNTAVSTLPANGPAVALKK